MQSRERRQLVPSRTFPRFLRDCCPTRTFKPQWVRPGSDRPDISNRLGRPIWASQNSPDRYLRIFVCLGFDVAHATLGSCSSNDSLGISSNFPSPRQRTRAEKAAANPVVSGHAHARHCVAALPHTSDLRQQIAGAGVRRGWARLDRASEWAQTAGSTMGQKMIPEGGDQ